MKHAHHQNTFCTGSARQEITVMDARAIRNALLENFGGITKPRLFNLRDRTDYLSAGVPVFDIRGRHRAETGQRAQTDKNACSSYVVLQCQLLL